MPASGTMTPGADTMRALVRLCHRLRQEGFGVTSGRVLDAVRSVVAVNLARREDVKLALRTNLVSSREDLDRFLASARRDGGRPHE